MCYLDDGYGCTGNVNLVDDSIGAFSNTISMLGTLKLSRAGRMWVCGQRFNRADDSGEHLSRKLPEFLGS